MELRTPVVLIIFRRPDTTQKVFEVIRQVQPSKLFVIADGPRLDKPGEAEKCMAARKIIEQVDWNCEVLTNYSDINWGCKQRVSSGLDWVFSLVEEAIILEDDCVPDPTFFYFCQELLERYRNETRVIQITGENTHGYQSPNSSYYFSQYSFYWGWATWRRAWKLYDGSLKLWPQLRDTKWLDDLLGNERAVQYWSKIFDLVYEGFNSWGWAWSFTCFLHQGLCVGSNVNLISNIGFGVDAAHTNQEVDEIANIPLKAASFPLKHPNQLVRDQEADRVIDHYRFSGRQYFRGLRKQALEKLNTGKNIEALQLFEECIAFRPDQVGLYYGKAVSLARLGRINDAITALKSLTDIIPHHQKANVLLGEMRSNILSISSKNPDQERLLYRYISLEDVVTVCSSIHKIEIKFSNQQSIGQNLSQEDYWENLWIFNNGSNQDLKVICLVRNPIEVNILGFFNNIEKHYPTLTKMQINEMDVNEMIDKFISLDPAFYLTEVDKKFRDWFGFDIYETSFSALGWKTYLHQKYHILVMQFELPDSEKENLIKSCFSMKGFKFKNQNSMAEKWYHKRYLELKKKLILSREYLNRCLFSQYAKQFYTEEQRESFYQLYHLQSLI
ncbi:putative capsular polysaccharide synthesis family protein [Limnoraphis robusta Tam1]|uniref:putative capsular polysaccharide synthesis family protein n=1 Tax=Limnoraphis robusta TaxID=1118279 RepID=UPI002B1FB0AF|nr:putative capsular polysaccharide synthesis family protein [Limnoraphis robusta]MEA5497929.1 putative capsular polysaccharide synthesis family protein [Limnoraphis robusta BA-68 BA1]MEA5540189.1 putative capsular polysaccharide synthesis family protein [Limnoraphis robusta Tam1]